MKPSANHGQQQRIIILDFNPGLIHPQRRIKLVALCEGAEQMWDRGSTEAEKNSGGVGLNRAR